MRNSSPRLDRKARIFYNVPCPKIVGAEISPTEEKRVFLLRTSPRGEVFLSTFSVILNFAF
jgi:hypothetical protein